MCMLVLSLACILSWLICEAFFYFLFVEQVYPLTYLIENSSVSKIKMFLIVSTLWSGAFLVFLHLASVILQKASGPI